ncbi:Metallo-hydrolase/oxidoreductase [Nemania abortiva]|nr:Metallo-hydrolase/oxidoreductase [Nemania abortiva]
MNTNIDDDIVTLEWFGATTFRLKTKGITIFLDAWLERPEPLKTYLRIDDVDQCDYIFISHAHFDHLPGADRLAKATGAIIVGNGEAINVMRAAGVPEAQLIAVSGGERIPLFTRTQRDSAIEKAKNAPPAPPGHGPLGPPMPDPCKAVLSVHAWPSLHCLATSSNLAEFPEFIDSAGVYTGSADYACTIDITRALTYDLGRLVKAPSLPPQTTDAMKSFVGYMKDTERNRYSNYDGGQIMYNFLIGTNTLLWNGHLGAYEGIVKGLSPQPDVAVLGIAGRANLNGRPYDGSAADFVTMQVKWLGEPSKVIWCLHDEAIMPPKYTDTAAATESLHRNTKSQVVNLVHGKLWKLF